MNSLNSWVRNWTQLPSGSTTNILPFKICSILDSDIHVVIISYIPLLSHTYTCVPYIYIEHTFQACRWQSWLCYVVVCQWFPSLKKKKKLNWRSVVLYRVSQGVIFFCSYSTSKPFWSSVQLILSFLQSQIKSKHDCAFSIVAGCGIVYSSLLYLRLTF